MLPSCAAIPPREELQFGRTFSSAWNPTFNLDFRTGFGFKAQHLRECLCLINKGVVAVLCVLFLLQESQLCAQQPVQSELVQRCQQLQSRLSTLKIENEEVSSKPTLSNNPPQPLPGVVGP